MHGECTALRGIGEDIGHGLVGISDRRIVHKPRGNAFRRIVQCLSGLSVAGKAVTSAAELVLKSRC